MRLIVYLLIMGGMMLSSCATTPTEVETPAAEGKETAEEVTLRDCSNVSIANPATVYCGFLGYTTSIEETDAGQKGICIFPDNTSCEEWEFLRGACGQQYSYCGLQGYGIETRSDGKDYFSREYAVCVDENGQVVGSVVEISGLLDHLGCNP